MVIFHSYVCLPEGTSNKSFPESWPSAEESGDMTYVMRHLGPGRGVGVMGSGRDFGDLWGFEASKMVISMIEASKMVISMI
jgi:hypothetical protein